MITAIDKLFIWSMYGGIGLLAMTLCDKDITTRGPIGSSISLAVGFVAVYLSRPILASLARYQLAVIIVLLWWFVFYLMAH